MNVYKFSTTTCGPCRMVQPVWNKIKKDLESDTIKFTEIVIDKDDSIYVKLFGITQVPTFIIADNSDHILTKLIGYKTEKELLIAIGNEH